MMRSITAAEHKKRNHPIRIWAVAVWLIIWQLASMWIGQEILLVSPVSAFSRLMELIWQIGFWQAIGFSFIRIVAGFLLACLLGILFAILSTGFAWFRELLTPAISVIKATPVASFIILALIWIPSRNLSIFISFLMVLPVVYSNVLEGIRCTDPLLLEMADLFQVHKFRRIRYLYVSQVLPFFRSACKISLGLCWKAGIAAEVIGIPKGSIGEHLYEAKVYLDTPDLFAWTAVIVLVSLLFERIFLLIIDKIVQYIERM